MDPKPRILVVDDDHDVLMLMQGILQGAGFAVETADSGRAAIQKVEASRPTLMTLDLVMPDVDGWGVLAHLRRVSAPPAVVVVTGHPESVGPFSVMASVAAYVVKPFSPADLANTCRKVVAGRAARRSEVDERRAQPRRLFVVEAKVVAPETGALATGHVVEVSPSGFRIDVDIPLEAGHSVDVAFMLPGHRDPMRARCTVRWRQGMTSGLELVDIDPEQAKALRDLVNPLGKPPVS
jgi:DNA-binding response OmpR family regulator